MKDATVGFSDSHTGTQETEWSLHPTSMALIGMVSPTTPRGGFGYITTPIVGETTRAETGTGTGGVETQAPSTTLRPTATRLMDSP